MRQRSLDEMITYFNQEIDKMDIDRRYKIALLGMVTAIGCTAKQTIEERKKGKWEWSTLPITGALEQKCSICGTPFYMAFRLGMNYCPNCGADMRGENDGERTKLQRMYLVNT